MSRTSSSRMRHVTGGLATRITPNREHRLPVEDPCDTKVIFRRQIAEGEAAEWWDLHDRARERGE